MITQLGAGSLSFQATVYMVFVMESLEDRGLLTERLSVWEAL